jgi:hypothetical protein
MRKLATGICAYVLLLPLTALAQEWTKEQQEVLAFEQACVTAKSAEEAKACFHEDFVGWGAGVTFPTSKKERLPFIDDDFATNDRQSLLFKPLSVIVKGNMAVVTYIDAGKTKNKSTNEVKDYMARWTDVCLKEGGKWYWISDHGVDISTE